VAYHVKELFYTLQGEGMNVGRPAIFCRFTGCNLWSGREEDRASAVCRFCDTHFVGTDGHGGGRYPAAQELAQAALTRWPSRSARDSARPLLVCTGGEPLLQVDEALIVAFQDVGFEVAVETNGTVAPPPGLDWICMSPKAGTDLALTSGDELKLVYPQEGAEPERYAQLAFEHFYLQPMDGLLRQRNAELSLRYCLDHPQWRLSLQTHKLLGIP
jgi:7-carboxy-7-deazaguanine synthase